MTSIGTTAVREGTYRGPARREFYANGRFWVFYSDGVNMGYRTSTDGENWSDFTAIRTGISARMFAVCFDGTYVHYAFIDSPAGSDIIYRRGSLSGGSITWDAERVAEAGGAHGGGDNRDPAIAVDSEGYPFIGYHQNLDNVHYGRVVNSSTNDGTWTLDVSQLLSLHVEAVGIVSLTDRKMYVTYSYSDTIRGRLWSEGAWVAEETAGSVIAYSKLHSVTARGDNVHLAYQKWYYLAYRKRTFGVGWGTEVDINSTSLSSIIPSLCINLSTGDLYYFWNSYPMANHIYYRKYDAEQARWLDGVKWINETVEQLTSPYRLNSFYRLYYNYVGITYLTKTGRPYNVKFRFIGEEHAGEEQPEDSPAEEGAGTGPGETEEATVVTSTLSVSGTRHTTPVQGSVGTRLRTKRGKTNRHITWVPVVITKA